jgi:hypothetical protein
MGRWTIVNGVLGLIVVLLGYEIVATWSRGLPPVVVPAPAAPAAPEPHEKGKRAAEKAGSRAQQTPETLVAAITEKELFDPSRRPPAPEEMKAEATPAVTKPPDNVTMVGVRIFGKDREVFVNDATQTPPVGRRLRIGDQVAGYTVKKIEPTAITLISPSGDSVPLPLVIDKGKAPPTPGAPRAPVPGRPPQPAQAAQASPAAGPQGGMSTAAGVPVAPAVKPPGAPPVAAAAPRAPGQPPAGQQLPADVRHKLEQLRQTNKRSGRNK